MTNLIQNFERFHKFFKLSKGMADFYIKEVDPLFSIFREYMAPFLEIDN